MAVPPKKKSFEEWLATPQGIENPTPEERVVWKRVYDGVKTAPSVDEMKRRFCDWAIQYYVAGRLAARAGLIPIFGNLVHHAVEMFLKTALIEVISLKEMRDPNKYGHDLGKLWKRYKEKEADPALDRFNTMISDLNPFEDLRYQDKVRDAAINMNLTWQAGDAVEITGAAAPRTQRYEFFMSHVDDLVIEIMKRVGLDPKILTGSFGPAAREALEYQNTHAADWRLG